MSLSVIILDDDAIQVNMFNNVLHQHYSADQVRFFFASDGDEVLRLIGKNPGRPNLLITDISHPGVNGLELAGVCKQRYPGVKVLIQTGFAGDEIVEAAGRNADYVLQKPYHIHVLTDILDTLLAESEQAGRQSGSRVKE